MRQAKKIAPWLMILLYVVVLLGLVSAKRAQVVCRKVEVKIQDQTQNFFVEEADVLTLIQDKSEKIIGANIEAVDIDHLETLLRMQPSIKEADVYRTMRGDLAINVEQRNPIMRLINANGESYYVDSEGRLMPLSTKYTAHVLLINGELNEAYTKRKELNLSLKPANEEGETLLYDLFQLGSYIHNHPFWRAQIEQVYVQKGEFELIPRVGMQVIQFGNISDMEIKFNKLLALYEQGLPKYGWNRYETINLKYKDQVICTKR